MRPTEDLEHVRAATARLFRRLEALTDARAHGPSALPGWTRGHVLTHIARNADAHWRMNDAALAGTLVDMYEGGRPARNRAIDELAGRPASDLVQDVQASAARLEAQWDQLTDADWDRMTRPSGPGGAQRPIRGGVPSRWREVEVHHLDLDLGYSPSDWPTAYVRMDLPQVVLGLPAWARDLPDGASWQIHDETSGESWVLDREGVRAGRGEAVHHVRGPGHAVLAWLLGRGRSPALVADRTDDEPTAFALPRYVPFG